MLCQLSEQCGCSSCQDAILRCDYYVDFVSCVRYLLHVKQKGSPSKGDQLLARLAALANPHRLRIIAALASGGRNYVSQLARELGISRPLLHLHLQKLEDAGLVTSQLELSEDGKALNYFEVRSFDFELTPAAIAEAAKSLTAKFEP
jgi:DNA-binding transcriptional ArsR family regulator